MTYFVEMVEKRAKVVCWQMTPNKHWSFCFRTKKPEYLDILDGCILKAELIYMTEKLLLKYQNRILNIYIYIYKN